MKHKPRVKIPDDIAALVLFTSNRTCCVCRTPGKPLQIHHLDEDPSNNSIANLAVLCLDCHTETMVKGGFHRKLDSEQIRLYRDEWFRIVGRLEALPEPSTVKPASVETPDVENLDDKDMKHIVGILDRLREQKRYSELAIEYDDLGNQKLRDKYIEKALAGKNTDLESEVFFRSMQGRLDLINPKTFRRRLRKLENAGDWSGLARIYTKMEKWPEAAIAYCNFAIKRLKEGNVFTSAFHLAEMLDNGVVEQLFQEALKTFQQKGDIWWQYRSLQELGRQEEADQLLITHKTKIENSDQPYLKIAMYEAVGDIQKATEVSDQWEEGLIP